MMGVAKTIAKTANSSEPVPVEPVQANGHEQERKWIAHNTQTSSSSIRSHGRDCMGATIRAQQHGLNHEQKWIGCNKQTSSSTAGPVFKMSYVVGNPFSFV